MSYCRFGEADAYIFEHVNYGLYCMSCSLMPLEEYDGPFFGLEVFHGSFMAKYDYDKMLDHIAKHRAAGDYIPEDVDETLIFERDCQHDFNNEGYCSHCWFREIDLGKFDDTV